VGEGKVNANLITRIRQHPGKSLTVVPGGGFGLSSQTACTYLHDGDGIVSACLLESAGNDDIEEVVEFFCQQVVLAQRPTARLQEMGIAGLGEGPLVIVTYMDGMSEVDRAAAERAVMSLTKKSHHMGNLADWPTGVFL
jgi:hypothetical protein